MSPKGESPGRGANRGRGARGGRRGSSWDNQDEITVPPQRVDEDALKRVRWGPSHASLSSLPSSLHAVSGRLTGIESRTVECSDGRSCSHPFAILLQARMAYFEEKQAILAKFRDRALEEAANRGDVLLAP